MTVSSARDVYLAKCRLLYAAASAGGLSFQKVDRPHALEVSGNGKSVVFPIVTDDRTWKQTTVEEAFYVVLLDAQGFSNASLDDLMVVSVQATEATEATAQPLMKRDLIDERLRIAQLNDLVGPDKLSELVVLAGLFTQ
jgi:hypothetical protein